MHPAPNPRQRILESRKLLDDAITSFLALDLRGLSNVQARVEEARTPADQIEDVNQLVTAAARLFDVVDPALASMTITSEDATRMLQIATTPDVESLDSLQRSFRDEVTQEDISIWRTIVADLSPDIKALRPLADAVNEALATGLEYGGVEQTGPEQAGPRGFALAT